MVASEEKFISIKQQRMAASVAGNRDREQIAVEPGWLCSADHLFNPKSRGAIIGMHHAFTAKPFGEACMIGDIVAMGQKHCPDTAHRRDLFAELGGKPGRIYQHVAAFRFRTNYQVAPRSKARFRGKAAKVNILGNQNWEGVDADMRVMMLGSSDRGSRTSDESHQRPFGRVFGFGLMINDGSVAIIFECLRRNLAARIAINTRRVDEEIAGNILW